MAGQGQLGRRGEDAQSIVVLAIGGRKDERGLGEVELSGDGLHQRRTRSFGVEEDGERVATERAVGEDVNEVVFEGFHCLWLGVVPPPTGCRRTLCAATVPCAE